MSIGKNIKKLRTEKKLTQKQLSELTGISEVMISQYERGIRTPKNKNLLKLACILDKSGQKLLDEDLPFCLMLPDENIEEVKNSSIYLNVEHVSIKELDFYENELITNYRQLNEAGKKEASKRIEELTEITKYTKND